MFYLIFLEYPLFNKHKFQTSSPKWNRPGIYFHPKQQNLSFTPCGKKVGPNRNIELSILLHASIIAIANFRARDGVIPLQGRNGRDWGSTPHNHQAETRPAIAGPSDTGKRSVTEANMGSEKRKRGLRLRRNKGLRLERTRLSENCIKRWGRIWRFQFWGTERGTNSQGPEVGVQRPPHLLGLTAENWELAVLRRLEPTTTTPFQAFYTRTKWIELEIETSI